MCCYVLLMKLDRAFAPAISVYSNAGRQEESCHASGVYCMGKVGVWVAKFCKTILNTRK
jgi:hypothetical protein